ncbi:MAG: efflux RND transporter periplasmic adaptor subunit, partial [Phycisphaerae bacterium]
MTIGVALCTSLVPIRPTASGQTVSNAGPPDLTPAARPTRPTEVAGITSPQRTTTLAALRPSRIVQLKVSEGQTVREGELLVVLDDGVQRLRVEMAKAGADSLLGIELAQTRLREALVSLERLRHLTVGDSATDNELLEAETEAERARLLHKVAKFDHQQAAREYEYQQLLLERLHLRAPFSGYVTEILTEVGETVTEAREILRIVELDPLEVSIDCPLKLAGVVQVGKRVL